MSSTEQDLDRLVKELDREGGGGFQEYRSRLKPLPFAVKTTILISTPTGRDDFIRSRFFGAAPKFDF